MVRRVVVVRFEIACVAEVRFLLPSDMNLTVLFEFDLWYDIGSPLGMKLAVLLTTESL